MLVIRPVFCTTVGLEGSMHLFSRVNTKLDITQGLAFLELVWELSRAIEADSCDDTEKKSNYGCEYVGKVAQWTGFFSF